MRRPICLFYRPGLISLLLLPLLCIAFFYEKGWLQVYHIVRVFRITEEFYENRENDGFKFTPPPERRFQRITLDQDDGSNKCRLDSALLTLRNIVERQDTLRGIHFHFGEKAKYWTFVRALDICLSAKALHFVTLENDLRAYYTAPEKHDSTQICAPMLQNCVIVEPGPEEVMAQENAEKQVRQARLFRDILTELWLPALLLIAMGVFGLFDFRYAKKRKSSV